MKSVLVAAMLVLMLAPLVGHGAVARDTATLAADEEIRQSLRVWDEAYRQRDVQGLGRILAEDFTLTDASGAVLTRAQYLMSVVKSPDFSRVRSFASEDVTIQVDGDTAVVTGRSPVKGRAAGKGQAFAGNYRFTDQWEKQQGVWKAVATHATRVTTP